MAKEKINIKKEDLENLFINQNLSIKEISIKYNCSVDTIRRRLQKFGLKQGVSYKLKTDKIDPLSSLKQNIKDLYLSGKSCHEIGKIVNLSPRTVSYHLKKLQVQIRSTTKVCKNKFEILWNQGKSYKEIAKLMNLSINTIKTFKQNHKNEFIRTQYFSESNEFLTYEQEQFVLGSLLGDSSLSRPSANRSKNSRLCLVHSIKQKELFMKKLEILDNFMGNWKLYTPKPDKRTGLIYETYRGNSKTHPVFTQIWNLLYTNNKKSITTDYLDKITSPIALAYWFMDDGTYSGTIATNCFSESEIDLLINWLYNKWNINASKQKNKKHFVLHILEESRLLFETLIFPYIIPSMYYKLKHLNNLKIAESV